MPSLHSPAQHRRLPGPGPQPGGGTTSFPSAPSTRATGRPWTGPLKLGQIRTSPGKNIQARIRGNILWPSPTRRPHGPVHWEQERAGGGLLHPVRRDPSGGLGGPGGRAQDHGLSSWRPTSTGSGEIIPAQIIRKAPSAELRPDQTDQDTLPPYRPPGPDHELLPHRGLRLRRHRQAGVRARNVQWVIRTIDKNEYKRRQAAPGLNHLQGLRHGPAHPHRRQVRAVIFPPGRGGERRSGAPSFPAPLPRGRICVSTL